MTSENFEVARTLLSADVGAPLDDIGATSGWDGNTAEELEEEPTYLAKVGGLGVLARNLFGIAQAGESNRSFFSHSLRAIGLSSSSNDGVRLVFTTPNLEELQVLAETVFLSIPISKIKELCALDYRGQLEERKFSDLLEPDTRRALSMVKMGRVSKIFVEFAEPVLDPTALPAHISVENSQCASVWVFPHENGQAALLFLGGDPAAEISSLKKPELDQWIRDYVMSHLGTDVARWSISSWTKGRGAYSYISPDNSEDGFRPRQSLENTQLGGKLALGGEACSSKHPAFVSGAIHSAWRYISLIGRDRQ